MKGLTITTKAPHLKKRRLRYGTLGGGRFFGVPWWGWLLGATGLGAVILLIAKRKEVGALLDRPAWAKHVFDEITAAIPGLSVKSRLIVLAHAAYESGWGQGNRAAREANNLFNVTAGSAWKGDTLLVPNADLSYNTAECQRLGRPVQLQKNGKMACRIDQVWRKYPSYREALVDYWDFLGPNQNKGRYVTARNALQAGDLTAFGNALYAAGYFTLPAAEYVKTMQGVFTSASKLLNVLA